MSRTQARIVWIAAIVVGVSLLAALLLYWMISAGYFVIGLVAAIILGAILLIYASVSYDGAAFDVCQGSHCAMADGRDAAIDLPAKGDIRFTPAPPGSAKAPACRHR